MTKQEELAEAANDLKVGIKYLIDEFTQKTGISIKAMDIEFTNAHTHEIDMPIYVVCRIKIDVRL